MRGNVSSRWSRHGLVAVLAVLCLLCVSYMTTCAHAAAADGAAAVTASPTMPKKTGLSRVSASPSRVYKRNELVVLLTGPLRSRLTLVPYAHTRLPTCAPSAEALKAARVPRGSLVASLFSYRLKASNYSFGMLRDTSCEVACMATFAPNQKLQLLNLVRNRYAAQLFLGSDRILFDPHEVPLSVINADNDEINKKKRTASDSAQDDDDDDDDHKEDETDMTPMNEQSLRELKEYEQTHNAIGIPLGTINPDNKTADVTVAFNNHYSFAVYYRSIDDDTIEVSSVTVRVASAGRPKCASAKATTTAAAAAQTRASRAELPVLRNGLPVMSTETVPITYSVQWVALDGDLLSELQSYIAPALRRYQTMWHLKTTLCLLLLIFVVSVCIAAMVSRTVRKDFVLLRSRGGVRNGDDVAAPLMSTDTGAAVTVASAAASVYNDDIGWRLVSGDVFRCPAHAIALCALLGGGVQVLVMVVLVYGVLLLSVVQAVHMDSVALGLLLCYFASSGVSGWVCAHMLAFFGVRSLRTGLYVTFFVPVSLASLYVTTQLVFVQLRSSATMPLATALVLCVVAVVCSSTSAVAGLTLGFHQRVVAAPCVVSSIPRLVPVPQRRQRMVRLLLYACALLPFAVISVELKLLLSLIWGGKHIALFGMLAVISFEVFVFCVELSIVMTYMMLRAEDYHWWWRSFVMHALCGVYVFAYSVYFMCTSLSLSTGMSVVLYLLYSATIAALCALLMGTISFFASAAFVYCIYSNSKVA